MTNAETVFGLNQDGVPTHWYNILADFQAEIPRPRLSRAAAADPRRSAIRPQVPLSMFRQGRSRARFIEIPEPVRVEYQRWRPTPLYRARRLESALDTPARQRSLADQERIARAARAFDEDPAVKGLRERFGAEVDSASVKPAN